MTSRNRRSSSLLTSSFEGGVLAEPRILFGGGKEHIDPKIGLGLYGPYTVADTVKPTLSTIIVGIVGPPFMISDAEQWLEACSRELRNNGKEPFLYPHFPGFNGNHPFQCELITGDTWHESIRPRDIELALEPPDFYERVRKVIDLYINAVQVLADREPRPHVVLCCLPREIIDTCTIKRTKGGGEHIPQPRTRKRTTQSQRSRQQLSFLDELFEIIQDEQEENVHQNLRRGLKAETMKFALPTQLVWPKTLRLIEGEAIGRGQSAQDIATRAWNFCTALYHKAGGSPWRLANVEQGTCYVGISFYREIGQKSPLLRTSMAQAFTSSGDGYVLRGQPFEWKDWHSPHMSREVADSLIKSVIDMYKSQNRNNLPRRLVVHKTSRYWDDELDGIFNASENIPEVDLVALGTRGVQFYRSGNYPALRGTYVKFSDSNLLLYTVGYIPFLRSYPGARVPMPVEILEHHGDSPWKRILDDILGLTKMNWNTADFATGMPVTVAFSRRVGQILAEVPSGREVRPEYRYYM